MTAAAVAQYARSLVGTRYRLHGREPGSGLDCLGLVGYALSLAGKNPVLPNAYSLRQRVGVAPLYRFAAASGLTEVNDEIRAGDIVLFSLSGAQHHLAVRLDDQTIVHAHAGLRRVVEGPAGADWRILKTWRAT